MDSVLLVISRKTLKLALAITLFNQWLFLSNYTVEPPVATTSRKNTKCFRVKSLFMEPQSCKQPPLLNDRDHLWS